MPGFLPSLIPLALLLAGAQDAPAPVAPEIDPAAPTIALGVVDERMTVPVQIAGAGPYRFVIDTGAERTVISRELAGMLKLAAGPPMNVTAMSGRSVVDSVVIPSLTVSSVPEIGRILAPALWGQHLGGQGLLGIDTLRDHKVLIDFDKETMAISPSERVSKRPRASRDEIVVRARSLMGQLIVTDAEYEGRPIRVVIDTGSPVSVGNLAMQRLVARTTGRLQAMEMTSATGGKVSTRYALVDKVRIGSVTFAGLPIAFADVPPFKRFGLDRRPAMLLGMNALKFFRQVAIDFPNREVRFRMPREYRTYYRCDDARGVGCV
jgi:predicted aspartyl protease